MSCVTLNLSPRCLPFPCRLASGLLSIIQIYHLYQKLSAEGRKTLRNNPRAWDKPCNQVSTVEKQLRGYQMEPIPLHTSRVGSRDSVEVVVSPVTPRPISRPEDYEHLFPDDALPSSSGEGDSLGAARVCRWRQDRKDNSNGEMILQCVVTGDGAVGKVRPRLNGSLHLQALTNIATLDLFAYIVYNQRFPRRIYSHCVSWTTGAS